MYPKFNLYSNYNQFNHLHAPKYFDWVKDGTGTINFFADDYIKLHDVANDNKAKVALLIEPRTIQPKIYTYIERNWEKFDLIFSHDERILELPNSEPIYFMNWYKTYDVPKTKLISMVCSDKVLCKEHEERQKLADLLGDKVDHYGMYKGGRYCDYYECRAEYKYEVVVDNNWSGYWLSEKLANPLASKTIPIYLGGKYFPDNIATGGIIRVRTINDIVDVVNDILNNPEGDYNYDSPILGSCVVNNYLAIRNYQVFEDWFWTRYSKHLAKCV